MVRRVPAPFSSPWSSHLALFSPWLIGCFFCVRSCSCCYDCCSSILDFLCCSWCCPSSTLQKLHGCWRWVNQKSRWYILGCTSYWILRLILPPLRCNWDLCVTLWMILGGNLCTIKFWNIDLSSSLLRYPWSVVYGMKISWVPLMIVDASCHQQSVTRAKKIHARRWCLRLVDGVWLNVESEHHGLAFFLVAFSLLLRWHRDNWLTGWLTAWPEESPTFLSIVSDDVNRAV